LYTFIMLNAPANQDDPPSDRAMTPEAEAFEYSCRQLVARLAAAEPAALAELYDMTAGRVYALALRITAQRTAAEEVVSDVYLQVWRQAGRYNPARGRVLVWLLTICRSRALDALRRRILDHKILEEPRTEIADGEEPLDILLNTERRHAVHSALSILSVEQRQLLALAFYRGLTHSQLAAHTGMPLGTVKSLLRRAMQTLKQELLTEETL
jgi:RNA polymerase sigma factor (sigma-70 family)